MLPTATAKYDIPSAGLQRVSHDRIWYPACFGMACRLIVDDIEPWCDRFAHGFTPCREIEV